jgi:aspartate aminotransferase-like enzyme
VPSGLREPPRQGAIYLREEEKSLTDNGQKISDLDKKRMHAMAQKDIAPLSALLSDDLVYTQSTARLDTKKSLLEVMESGKTALVSFGWFGQRFRDRIWTATCATRAVYPPSSLVIPRGRVIT